MRHIFKIQTAIFMLILLTRFTNSTLAHQNIPEKDIPNKPLLICHDENDYSTGAYS